MKRGYKFIIGQLPVGSGKSVIAMAVSRAFGGGYITTPFISLQNQYLHQFDDTTPLIGRSRFSCRRHDREAADKAIKIIKNGDIPPRPIEEESCAKAPCLNRPRNKAEKIKAACDVDGGCPHAIHLRKAQEVETVVSNVHSFLFSISMTGNLLPRRVLIVDEAHKLQGILLDHLKIRFKIRRRVDPKEYADFTKTEHWVEFLRAPEQVLALGDDQDVRDSWVARLERLEKLGDTVWRTWDDPDDRCLWLEIGPFSVANQAKWLLWDNADVVLLMSGTILDKDSYCRGLGIRPEEALYIDIPSDFPVENRIIYLPKTDIVLDFKNFDKNVTKAAKEINRIVSLPENADVKCLIHTNSYRHAQELIRHCKNHRMITHTPETFHQVLSEFVTSEGNQIMVSPSMAEGVDLRDDLCRCIIVLTPAYPNVNDPYWRKKLDVGAWNEYNCEAIRHLMQALGRGVRHNKDFARSYLIDARFVNLLRRNYKLLPKWWLDSLR